MFFLTFYSFFTQVSQSLSPGSKLYNTNPNINSISSDLNQNKNTKDEITYELADDGSTIIYSGTGMVTKEQAQHALRKKKIVFSEGITSIQGHAFRQVSYPEEGEENYFDYEEIEFPRSLITIGPWAFVSVITKLRRIHFPDYKPGIPESEITEEELENFYSLRNLEGACLMTNYYLTDCNIPGTFTTFGDSVFSRVPIKHIRLNSKLTSIGNNCFHFCPELTEITLPSSINNIGTCAFANCPNLKKIDWISPVTAFFGSNTFEYSTSLEEFTFPPSATIYSSGKIFINCISLKKCVMPVTLLDLTRIDTMFADCINLVSCTFPENLKTVGPSMFRNTSIETAFLPETVTTVDAASFRDCLKLKYVNIPSKEGIWFGNNVFQNTPNLVLLVVSGNLTRKLGSNMFGGQTFCYYGLANQESSGSVVPSYTKIFVTEKFSKKYETFGISVTFPYGTFDGYPYEVMTEDTCKFPDEYLTPSPSPRQSSHPTNTPTVSASQTATKTVTQSEVQFFTDTDGISQAETFSSSQATTSPTEITVTFSEVVTEVPKPSDNDQEMEKKGKLQTWQIVVIAICSFVAVGIVAVITYYIIRKKKKNEEYPVRIGSLSEENVEEGLVAPSSANL